MIEHKRRKSPISHLPDSLFYGEDMQNMLAACTDIVHWHNDIFGFQKVRSVQHSPHHMCLSDSLGQTGDFTLLHSLT